MRSVLEALFPETRRALLVGFFRQPDRRFYLREVQRLVGMGRGTVQRELANLVAAGILARADEHGRSYYSADRGSPVYSELRSLVEKTAGVTTVLGAALEAVAGIAVAFVFGSAARGDARSDSDLDVAVIGVASFREVVNALGDVQRRLGREINPVVFSADEIAARWRREDPFVREVVRGGKLFIIGTEDDLGAVVEKSLAD